MKCLDGKENQNCSLEEGGRAGLVTTSDITLNDCRPLRWFHSGRLALTRHYDLSEPTYITEAQRTLF